MSIISFYADKIAPLAQLSLDNPGHRRPTMDQRYAVDMVRADLPIERRKEIILQSEDGFCFDIQDDEIDLNKIPAGIWIVGDTGICIMSNISMDTPGLVTEPIEHAVQACESDPRNVGRDGQYDAKDDIFGGDDGVIFIDAEFILAACQAAKIQKTDVLMLEMTEESVGAVSPKQAKAYMKMMQADDPLFFDPDQKAPAQKTWKSPEVEETTLDI